MFKAAFILALAFTAKLALAADDPYARSLVDKDAYANESANKCLISLTHGLVISSPSTPDTTMIPDSQVFVYPANSSWDGGVDKAPQVTTVDKAVLNNGAISAIVTPTGKVVQIMGNGSCVVGEKKFNSSYEFIATQLKKQSKRVADVLSKDEKAEVKKRCAKLNSNEPFQSLKVELVRLGLIDAPQAADAATPSSTH